MKSFKQFLEQQYQVNLRDIEAVWDDVNSKLFDGHLERPKFSLEDDLNYLVPEEHRLKDASILGFCDQVGNKIVLRFCKKIHNPRELIEVVAHEMVHQDMAQKFSYKEMCNYGHGKEFMAYAPLLKKYHNIILSQTLGDD